MIVRHWIKARNFINLGCPINRPMKLGAFESSEWVAYSYKLCETCSKEDSCCIFIPDFFFQSFNAKLYEDFEKPNFINSKQKLLFSHVQTETLV